MRGGYVTVLADDWAFIRWVAQWAERLQTLQKAPEKHVGRQPQQSLVGDDWKGAMLETLPGMGRTKAEAALAEGSGRVALALQYLTGEGHKVPGVGPTLRARARRALGLEPDEQIIVMNEEWLSGIASFLLAHDEIGAWDQAAKQYGTLMDLLGVHSAVGGSWEKWTEGAIEENKE